MNLGLNVPTWLGRAGVALGIFVCQPLDFHAQTACCTSGTDNTAPVISGAPANLTVSCDNVPALPCGPSTGCDIQPGDYKTFTQGGWGAVCSGGNPGCYRDANFASAFPSGLVMGCSNFTLALTSALAVEVFVPCGGPASALTQSFVNPACISNVLAGQLVASSLNAGFDAFDPNFSASNSSISSLVYTSGPFTGQTVAQVLVEANNALGGCGSAYSFSQIVSALDQFNRNFDNGNQNLGFLTCGSGSSGGSCLGCDGITVTDNCDATPSISCTKDTTAGNCPGNYTITRTWTATDDCGNTSSVSQVVTVSDNSAPVLVGVPANATVSCGIVPAAPSVTATDNCGSATVAMTETTTGNNCAGTVTRTWTATDACGNTASASQVISWNDNTAPVLSGVPANASAACDAVLAPANVTATDDCGNATVTMTETNSGSACGGTITRTWTATDACGNTSSASQVISLTDNTAPVLVGVPSDATVSCGIVPAAATVSATDNCGNATVAMTETNTGNSCAGSVTRTWTATDECGNTSSASQVISWNDNTAPVLSGVPANASAACDAVPAPANVTATDDCGNATVTMTETNSGSACGGTITRTWTATDACGNSSSASQVISLTDNTAPVLVGVPSDATVSCGIVPAAATVSATDNCGNATVAMTETNSGNSCAGSVTRTWTATDECGNTSSASQVISWNDNTAPVLVGVPSDATVSCGIVPAAATVSATDNCGNATVAMTETNSGNSCAGSVTRTWTATDECGNTSSASQVISWNDNTAPVLVGVPANATASCGNVPAAATVTATDNCGNANVTMTETNSGTSCGGTVTRTWTATDACGNTSSASQTITLTDNTAPVLVGVPANATAVCGNLPAAPTVTATDNCGNATVAMTQSNSGTSCGGTVTRTWTATDACGNTSSASQIITLTDNVAPVAVCSSITVSVVNGSVTISAGQINGGSSDNCTPASGLTYTLSQTVFTCADNGANVVTLTVADACGNSSNCQAIVTVEGGDCDVEFGTCPNNIVAACTTSCTNNTCSGHGCAGGHSGYCSKNECGGHDCHGSHSGYCSGHECKGNGCNGGHSGTCSANTCTGHTCSGNHNGYCKGNSCTGNKCHGKHGGTCSRTVCSGNTCSGGHGGYCSNNTCSAQNCTGNHGGYCSRRVCEGSQCEGHHGGKCNRTKCSSYGCSGNHSGYCSSSVCGGSYCSGSHSGYCVKNNCKGDDCDGGHSGSCSRNTCTGSTCGGSHSGYCTGRGCTGHGCSGSHNGYCSRKSCTGSSCKGEHGGKCKRGTTSNGCSGGYNNGGCGSTSTACNGHVGSSTCGSTSSGSCSTGAIVTWVAPTATATSGCAVSTCPTNTTICNFSYLGEYNGHRYYISNGSTSWTNARNQAIANGGYLASITSSAENNWLLSAVSSVDAWIGYNDVSSEGSFSWTNGETGSYSYWAAGEPNNQTPNTCCTGADFTAFNGGNGNWYDRGSCESYKYIMEIPCSSNACTSTVTQIAGPASGSFFTSGTTTTITYVATTSGGDTDTCSFTVTVGNCAANYCNVSGSNSCYEWIRNVAMSNLNNTSGSNGGYGNFTQYSANVALGQSYTITLRAGYGSSTSYSENWRVYVDWNKDGDFTDMGELEWSGSGAGSVYGTVSVPSGVTLGSTRMRVMMNYGCSSSGSCTSFSYGEVEDYTINITNGARMAEAETGTTEAESAETQAPAFVPVSGVEISQIWPNPADRELSLGFTSLKSEQVMIEILSMDGAVVKSIPFQTQERDNAAKVDVSALAAGSYFIQIKVGNVTVAEKFVKL